MWQVMLSKPMHSSAMETRKYYIEAFLADGSPLLGNLDGQAVVYAKNYKRSEEYKRVSNRFFRSQAAYHLVIDALTRAVKERIDHGR